jgi:hypothetical protein
MRWSRWLLAVAVGTLVTVSAGVTQAASASTPTPQNCAVLISKAPNPQSDSPVVSTTCSAGTPVVPAESTLLVRFYQHANYGGLNTAVYGDSGPCDSAGYRLPDLGFANALVGGISSYRVYSNCNYTKICNGLPGDNYYCSGYRCWDAAYVGDLYNDRVLQMWLRNYVYCV